MPALALLLGGNLHSGQEPRNGDGAHALAMHLFDSSNGSHFSLVVYDHASDLTLTVGSPSALGGGG